MSWKLAIPVSLITAFITAILAIIVATYVADRLGVNDRDGGRSMSIFFFIAPAAFIVGICIGLFGTYLMVASAGARFWPAMGASAGISVVLNLAVAGYFLLSAPAATRSNPGPFIVEVQVYLPLDRVPTDPEKHAPMQMTMNSASDATFPLSVDLAHIQRGSDHWAVPAAADLQLTTTTGVLSFFIDENNWLELRDLPIVRPPSGTSPAWSRPMPMQDMLMQVPHTSVVQARVRVVRREVSAPGARSK